MVEIRARASLVEDRWARDRKQVGRGDRYRGKIEKERKKKGGIDNVNRV